MRKRVTREAFRRRVRDVRIKYGWTQSQLAKHAGISRSYVQSIESNQPPNITLDIMDKIARALKATCSDLARNL